MLPRATLLSAILLAVLVAPVHAQNEPEQAVKAYLQKAGGGDAQLLTKGEPALAEVFPNHTFVVARFRIYPVAREIPAGLKPSNVFAVTKKERRPTLIKDAKALEQFFVANQVPAKTEPLVRASLAAWLTLAQEFHQDGFYKFEVLPKEFSLESNEALRVVSGRALVVQGGKGEMAATLTYADGKLTAAKEAAKIMEGPRPICQATKLLDPDPVVRRMAERDLLFMGLPARDYLMEQRQRASPELREAIDALWRRIEAAGW